MPVTSTDVARRAGVSRATVSYVLNATPGQTIPESTRRTVLAAADELGYRPNVLARSLRRGRGEVVLCPLPGIELNYALGQLVQECVHALEPQGLTLVPDFTRHDDPAQQLAAWLRLAPAAVVDVLLHHDDPLLAALRDSGVPVVSATLPGESPWESSGDVFAGSQRQAQLDYLLRQGHRTVHAVLPTTYPIDPRTEHRMLDGLRHRATAAGAQLTLHRLDLTADGVRHLARKLVSGGLPDAVAAHNDDYAMAVISALMAEGVRVPGDVAVMGIDDVPLGRVFTPALTTLAGDFAGFGRALAASVDRLLGGAPPGDPLPVPEHVLVVRESA